MTSYRRILLIVFVAGAVMIGVGIYEVYVRDDVPIAEPTFAENLHEAQEVTVYVCGAVNHPGVVPVAEHSRVIDAVKLCGGVLPTADITQVNMAKLVSDGEQIVIPEKAEIREDARREKNSPTGGEESPKFVSGKININTAGKEELDRLPGIGPAMAEAIIAHRAQEGAFQS